MAATYTYQFRLWHWLLIVFVLAAMAIFVTRHWMGQAEVARGELRQSMLAIEKSDRRALQAHWGEKVSWTPSPTAPLTLAVMPRTRKLDFDAIYACYDGQRVVATLALTSVGGYFDNAPMNNRKYPRTLIDRQLNAGEIQGLSRMTWLLEQRLKGLDPQTDRYGWTQEVLRTARALEQAQSRTLADTKIAAK